MRHLPNGLSVARLVTTAPIVLCVVIGDLWSYRLALILLVLSVVSDLLDGYLARRYNFASKLGLFLDLTADKVLVCGLLVSFVQVRLIPSWVAVVILGCDVIVTNLRSVAVLEGNVISPQFWGKWKATITIFAIGSILLSEGIGANAVFALGLPLTISPARDGPSYLLNASDMLLLIAVMANIISAILHFQGAAALLKTSETV